MNTVHNTEYTVVIGWCVEPCVVTMLMCLCTLPVHVLSSMSGTGVGNVIGFHCQSAGRKWRQMNGTSPRADAQLALLRELPNIAFQQSNLLYGLE